MVVADTKLTAPGSRHGEVPENEIRTALVIRVRSEEHTSELQSH